MKIKVGDAVTRDHLKILDNTPYFLEFQSVPVQQPDTRKLDANGVLVGKAPPKLVHVAQFVEDEATGDVFAKDYVIIINAVLAGIIESEFPGDTIIGQRLQVIRFSKREGKNYNDFKVTHFELEESAAPAAKAKK